MNKQLQDKLGHCKRENDELRSAARGALAALRADK